MIEVRWYCPCAASMLLEQDGAACWYYSGTLATCSVCDGSVGPVPESYDVMAAGWKK